MFNVISKHTCDINCPLKKCMNKTIWVIKYETEGLIRNIHLCTELNKVINTLSTNPMVESLKENEIS
jgi:hypothetical protein